MTSLQSRTVTIVCVATAMLMLDIAVVNTALPHIARDLHSGITGLQWVVDAYTVVLAAFVLTAGSLADRFGRRRGLRLGLALFTASSVICASARSIGVLDVARCVQGFGAAVMFATSLAVLAAAFPEAKDRGGAFAAYGATIGASFAVGPLVGGLLTTELGWRSIFTVNVPLGLAMLAGTTSVGESRDPSPRRPDWVGQGLSAAGLFLLVLALLRANQVGWSSSTIVTELVVAAALLVAFVIVERLRREPMLPMTMFRSRAFSGAQVAAFAISASFFSIFFYLTLYLQGILHLSPIRAGLVLLPGTLLLFVLSGASAQLVGRVSFRLMISGGLAAVALGLMTMILAGVHSSWTVLLIGEALTGIGTGVFNPALSHVALSEVSGRDNGLVAGVNVAFRQTGIAVGVAVLGVLIPGRDALGTGSASEYVHGLHTALFVGAAIAGLGAMAAAALIRGPGELAAIRDTLTQTLAIEAARSMQGSDRNQIAPTIRTYSEPKAQATSNPPRDATCPTPTKPRTRVTRASPSDIPAVVAMMRRCSQISLLHRFHGPTDGIAVTTDQLGRDVDIVAVAWEGQSCVGMGVLAPDSTGAFHLGVLVQDDRQRRGIGTDLFAALKHRALRRGVQWVHADVMGDNPTRGNPSTPRTDPCRGRAGDVLGRHRPRPRRSVGSSRS